MSSHASSGASGVSSRLHHPVDRGSRREAEQRQFFEDVSSLTREAEKRIDVIERFIDVAGLPVRIRYGGNAMYDAFWPALAHLEIPPTDDPGATLRLWTSAGTGLRMVPPPVGRDAFTDRGDIWGYDSRVVRSAFLWGESALALLDTTIGEGIYWVEDPAAIPYWAKASPLRTQFHWLMLAEGKQLIHAACVGQEDGAVLICGRGGVGKSTTALSCLDAGMGYVGDDYLVVGLDPEPMAYSLYGTAKLVAEKAAAFDRFGGRAAQDAARPGEKAVVAIAGDHGSRLMRRLPIKAILTPRFSDDSATSFAPTSSGALIRAAAFTTTAQLPHSGRETYSFVERLVETVPGCEIRLGRDIGAVPAAIEALLAEKIAMPRRRIDTSATLPLVSVIIPVFNGTHFLPDAIRNVVSQDIGKLEIIVVDDGSTEDVGAALGALPVDVRLLRQSNAGPSAARNRGLAAAAGDYVAFLDVDDLWTPDALQLLGAALAADPDLDAVHARARLVRYGAEDAYLGSPEETFPYYIGAGVYRRSAFDKAGAFDVTLRFGEDTEWFARARLVGARILELPEDVLLVRRHDGNMTAGKSLVEVNTLQVFKRIRDLQNRRKV